MKINYLDLFSGLEGLFKMKTIITIGVIVICIISAVFLYSKIVGFNIGITEDGKEIFGLIGDPDRTCLNGVVYYYGSHSLAPAYKQNGELIKCEIKNSKDLK